MLSAVATDAGTYPTREVVRTEPSTGKVLATFEKGGWIELDWETRPGQFETRYVQVDRAKALEAMSRIARREETA